MRAKHLWEWLREHCAAEAVENSEIITEPDEREGGSDEGGEEGEERDHPKWNMVVELVQTSFRDRYLAEEATWQAVVLILKGGRDYHEIGLV